MTWQEDPLNQEHVAALRGRIADDARMMIFLGAGLSFGAARLFARERFDDEQWGWRMSPSKKEQDDDREYKDKGRKPKKWRRDYGIGPPGGGPPWDGPGYLYAWDDDDLPLPSWPWLVGRMRDRLASRCPTEHESSLNKFFHDEGPLDCAQLFRQTVGDANYTEFLREQFDISRYPMVAPTPSHDALVALGLPLLFTTNYDELLERAHLTAGIGLRVSADEAEFKAHRALRPERHLVKLHGSIDRIETVVLTREDYSWARQQRQEMFAHLRGEMSDTTFLFVGFSLSDPNFTTLRDDLRRTLGMEIPPSYTVQGSRDPIKATYLESLDVNTVWLDSWNALPSFIEAINPIGADATLPD